MAETATSLTGVDRNFAYFLDARHTRYEAISPAIFSKIAGRWPISCCGRGPNPPLEADLVGTFQQICLKPNIKPGSALNVTTVRVSFVGPPLRPLCAFRKNPSERALNLSKAQQHFVGLLTPQKPL
jgi:hypothetical protein